MWQETRLLDSLTARIGSGALLELHCREPSAVRGPTVISFLRGCIFGGLLRLLIDNQIIWAMNLVCRASGSARFTTDDSSRNNLLLVLPSFGEGCITITMLLLVCPLRASFRENRPWLVGIIAPAKDRARFERETTQHRSA